MTAFDFLRSRKSKLFKAIQSGDVQAVERLVKRGADVNARQRIDTSILRIDGKGYEQLHTPLMLAVELGNLEITRILLKHDGDVLTRDVCAGTSVKRGADFLTNAIFNGHTETVRLLLQHRPLLVASGCLSLQGLMGVTIRCEKPDILALLLETQKEVGAKADDATLLCEAVEVEKDQLHMVEMLIQAGFDLDGKGQDGRTALEIALGKGAEETTRLLLSAGADLEATDVLGRTLLLRAAAQGYQDMVGAALSHGANPNALDKDGSSALDHAVATNQRTIARLLLEAGAPANHRLRSGWTILMLATKVGDSELVHLLMDHGADPRAESEQGDNCLSIALAEDHLEIVKVLIEHKDAANWTKDRVAQHVVAESRSPQNLKGLQNLLQQLLDPPVVLPLLEQLQHPEDKVRSIAGRLVTDFLKQGVLPSLSAALKHEDATVRLFAIQLVRNAAMADTLEDLQEVLKDPDSEVRVNAVLALDEIKNPRANQRLLEALADEDGGVRLAAAALLETRSDEIEATQCLAAFRGNQEQRTLATKVVEQHFLERVSNQFQMDLLNSIREEDKEFVDVTVTYLFAHPEERCEEVDDLIRQSQLLGDYTEDIIKASLGWASVKSRQTSRNEYDSYTHGELSHDTSENERAIQALCKSKSSITSNILHLVQKKKDLQVAIGWNCSMVEYGNLSFAKQREMAQQELSRRGNPPYDPSAYLHQELWKR